MNQQQRKLIEAQARLEHAARLVNHGVKGRMEPELATEAALALVMKAVDWLEGRTTG